jgi:electron-transferring-flavoprotein dehydrogenase
MSEMANVERQSMEVDLVCVGFGPATGGFLTTLSRAMQDPETQPFLVSKAVPGMPLQVVCYERADDIGFGVSGVVTRARGIRASFPDLEPGESLPEGPRRREPASQGRERPRCRHGEPEAAR